MNTFPSVDYSLYADGETVNNFMDIKPIRSLQWSFALADFAVRLDRTGYLSLSSGIQMLWNDYTFSNDITLDKVGGIIVPRAIDSSYKKSKLTTWGFQIPVLLEINLPGRIFLAGGLYGGVNVSTNTKIKSPKEKMRDPYLNTFYAGWTARVGYDRFFVYGNCALTQMFVDDKGPEIYPLTIGIGFAF